MDNWRRQKGGNYNQQIQRTTGSYNKTPPMSSQPASVPSWEKKFCTSIGSVPWRKLLETKKYMHLYNNVVQWNDCAGEEAFNNAKCRFWAEINGLPCNISLPGSDIYIDEINWNCEIDPELILDLERGPVVTNDEEEVSIDGNLLLLNQPIPCSGWGEEEEDQGKATNSYSGLGNCDKNVGNNDNLLESSCLQSNETMNENGWENFWNDSWGSEMWANNVYKSQNFNSRGTWDLNLSNGEVDDWHMSRYKTSRFHGDDYQMDHGWRNEKWKKTVNHVYKDRKPTSGQWKMINSCQPSNFGSGRAKHSWNCEKPVSSMALC